MSARLEKMAMAGPRVFLQNTTVNGTTGPRFTLDSDGFAYSVAFSGGPSTQLFQWCHPAALSALFEVVWTAVSGTVDTTPGAAGAGLQLNVDRAWAEITPSGTEQAVFDIIIRPAGGGATLASARITLNGDAL